MNLMGRFIPSVDEAGYKLSQAARSDMRLIKRVRVKSVRDSDTRESARF